MHRHHPPTQPPQAGPLPPIGRSEQEFRTLVDGIPQLCWIAQADGAVIWYNRRWYEFTGTTPSEMEGWGWEAVHDPAVLPKVLERWNDSIATGEPFEMTFPLRRADGVFRHFLTRVLPLRNQGGRVVRWFGTNTDVTEQREAEEQLRRAHDQLDLRVRQRTEELDATVQTLLHEIGERQRIEQHLRRLNRLYVVLSEIDQAIVRAKSRGALFRDFCRIATEEGGFLLAWVGLVDGNGNVRVTAASGATGYLEGMTVSLTGESAKGPTGISVRKGTYYICNDFQNAECTRPWHERGRSFGIGSSASIVLKEDGAAIGALTLYSTEKDFFDDQQVALLRQMGADISFAMENLKREQRRREAEKALQQETLERLWTMETLREKERMLIQQNRQAALGEMIGNIAHQWRQPLNSIALLVQELPMTYDAGSFSREYLDKTVATVMSVIHHMSHTIDDFRNFFRPDKEKVTFPVRQVVDNVIGIVDASLRSHGIRLEVTGHGDPQILGYPNEYSQVVMNVLLNARDVLTHRAIEDPRIQVEFANEGERSVVTIRDNAGGIPPEIADKIFDPYFTTKGPDQGTGLGLYMSKAIIEKSMNGRITASNAGEGAEFRIEV
ncbi:ATP-binding protein [Geomonas sp. Red276]